MDDFTTALSCSAAMALLGEALQNDLFGQRPLNRRRHSNWLGARLAGFLES